MSSRCNSYVCVRVCVRVCVCVCVCDRRVLQCVTVAHSVLQFVTVCCSVLRCVAVCCSALQCVAMCCSVLQYVALIHYISKPQPRPSFFRFLLPHSCEKRPHSCEKRPHSCVATRPTQPIAHHIHIWFKCVMNKCYIWNE